ncbi:hypothetical protein TR13x_07735 [Caloranaerobacter sp. TR13]|uniref:YesL family protein n=1 Tax=Caloranaerobacter sp. TR13 TaxID=1302151 RepID=UPI0006D441FB|nr:YesL family protein [Caloranaerobacter sp. TR13]KPU26897.1 hypothetical protein TR13x_07735 [Caloranaerobacter sp. TR13]
MDEWKKQDINEYECLEPFEEQKETKGPFRKFLRRFSDEYGKFIFVNFLFVICSLPIVTIGLSITGLFYVMMRFVEDEYVDVFYHFKKGIVDNFKKGLIAGIVVLLTITVVYFLFYIGYYNGVILDNFIGKLILIMSFFILFTGIMVHLFVFTMIVRYDIPLRRIYKNTFGILMLNMAKGIVITSIPLIISIILLMIPYASTFYFILYFSIVSYIVISNILNIFIRYE